MSVLLGIDFSWENDSETEKDSAREIGWLDHRKIEEEKAFNR